MRQSHLQKVYNFTCTCSLCLIPSADETLSHQTIHSPHLIDPFRSFYCPNLNCNGIVHAIYTSFPFNNVDHQNEDSLYTALEPNNTTTNDDNDNNNKDENGGEDDDDEYEDVDDDDDEYEDVDDEGVDDEDQNNNNNDNSNSNNNKDLKSTNSSSELNLYVGFKCTSCLWHTKTESEWKSFLDAEKEFCNHSPETLTDYISWKSTHLSELNRTTVEQRQIHPKHYLVFWLEDNLVNMSLEVKENMLEAITTLRGMIDRLNSFPDNIIPSILHEKVLYWDRLGQAAVVYADQLYNSSRKSSNPSKRKSDGKTTGFNQDHYNSILELARTAFTEGYKMSKSSCGESSQTTQDLKKLAGKFFLSFQILI